ncbi:hypothetical protein L0664_18245 [Octadecabacter sp. G9-8]|uniref:Uncharacterized protein n=1 Tax=Octadecabacter dasysiphoniae TaxID=2909341 RepID=A0ABS9D0F6_9RHOB|nr:hypothetical protein [Octadecabacter dasysiphoniae]MCF2873010.1 hypothetical protein [Octadecabacter dasysiphoniae]
MAERFETFNDAFIRAIDLQTHITRNAATRIWSARLLRQIDVLLRGNAVTTMDGQISLSNAAIQPHFQPHALTMIHILRTQSFNPDQG